MAKLFASDFWHTQHRNWDWAHSQKSILNLLQKAVLLFLCSFQWPTWRWPEEGHSTRLSPGCPALFARSWFFSWCSVAGAEFLRLWGERTDERGSGLPWLLQHSSSRAKMRLLVHGKHLSFCWMRAYLLVDVQQVSFCRCWKVERGQQTLPRSVILENISSQRLLSRFRKLWMSPSWFPQSCRWRGAARDTSTPGIFFWSRICQKKKHVPKSFINKNK